jgi:putative hemolysin
MLSAAFSQTLSLVLPISLPQPVRRVIAAAIGLPRLEKLYQELAAATDRRPLASRLLDQMRIRYRVSDKDRAQVPRTGPTILVANHPFGILDGAILSALLLSIRGDVKILANGILNTIPGVCDLLIAVDPMTGPSAAVCNIRGLREACRHVAAGGLLVVFPAGEVSHFQWIQHRIEDSEWNRIVARITAVLSRRGCATTIVPVHISGANSILFQAVGMLHPRLRTLFLARELTNKTGGKIEIQVGTPLSSARLMQMGSEDERTHYLRWRTYLLADRNPYKAKTALPICIRHRRTEPEAVAPPIAQSALSEEIVALGSTNMLVSSGELQVFIAGASQIPMTLDEIGRLRELTFRAVGEGTGKSKDIDSFDAEYQHLFLWNAQKQEIVGAYRLTGTDIAQTRPGSRGLYTATLFNYGEQFLAQISPALELGRSFIRTEYQRTFAPLLLLWRGIGRYLAGHPQYKILFGPVSISSSYQPASRELMVAWLQRRAFLEKWKHLVSGKGPFRSKFGLPEQWLPEIDDLSTVVEDIEPNQRGVPVLLRQYLKLGGKLLAFNVDPEFSYALDGLIVVDLTHTNKKLLERYLGRAEAESFLNFHMPGRANKNAKAGD